MSRSFNTLFKDLITDIKTKGQESKPRDLMVQELALGHIKLEPRKYFANFENRKFNFKYFAGELAWYMMRDCDVDYIGKFSGFWKNITNPGTNEINSNYGALLFGDQLQWAKDSLSRDINTRQAIAFLNQPKYQFEGNKDFVCTMYLNFWIRDNKLYMKVQMRSNDIFYGLTFDAPFFGFVHQHMLLWLNETYPDLQLGEYHHLADNIHFYEQHFELADKIVSENPDLNHDNKFEMNLKQPMFVLNHGTMELTDFGKEYISEVNRLVEAESKMQGYQDLLSKYLLN